MVSPPDPTRDERELLAAERVLELSELVSSGQPDWSSNPNSA
jgi:hypothetical protein